MLGDRIKDLRKQRGLSQEDLAEKLNVSRQAVSKWETGLSSPDTDNLILLADLFEITVDELVRKSGGDKAAPSGVPDKRKRLSVLIFSLLAAVILITAASIWLLPDKDDKNPEATAIITPFAEYSLTTSASGSSETRTLEIGLMDSAFTWDTGLSGENSFFTSGDMPGVEFHTVDCGDIVIHYNHSIETGADYIISMTTTSSEYETPRCIAAGDTETELISAYGDDLLFKPEYYSETDDFCMFNSLYVYLKENVSYDYIVFYVLDGHVTGIEVSKVQDGGPAYYANNVDTFRLKDGKPDYSEKQEPDLETLSKERNVYVSLHTLLNHTMTEKDAAPYREAIFSGLRDLDWPLYGKLGEAGKDAETIEELISWLDKQEKYSAGEMTGLQLALLSNLDGAYSEMYSTVLCNALIKDPVLFIECMDAGPELSDNSEEVARSVIYGAGPKSNIEGVRAIIDNLITCGALTDGAQIWALRLIELCDDALGNA